jgi:hypothetical protein
MIPAPRWALATAAIAFMGTACTSSLRSPASADGSGPPSDARAVDAPVDTPHCNPIPNCQACIGDPCDSTFTCNPSEGSDTMSTTCGCANGHVACCSTVYTPGGGPYLGSSCNYGDYPQPACPSAIPQMGDPCTPLNDCAYNEPCCGYHPTIAMCWNGTWLVDRCASSCDAGPNTLYDAANTGG